jgi:steroid delta-isomerase-like uncharacterized protein
MRRFITLATIALSAAVVVTQWQRVKELGRQVLSRGTTQEIGVSAEENKALVRRSFEEVFNQGNLDAIEEIFASDYVLHDPTSPEEIRGIEGMRQYVSMYRTAFPDLQQTIEDQIAEGEKVATRLTGRGTHQGELMGFPPTGNRVEAVGIVINRISGGKIAESWANYDALGMMQQIGAVPEPGQSEEASSTPSAGQEPPS